jgi:hypothetical protein
MSVANLPQLANGAALAANSSISAVVAQLTNGSSIAPADKASYSAVAGNRQRGVASSLQVIADFNALNPANGDTRQATAITISPSAQGALLTSLNLGAFQDPARFGTIVGTGAQALIPVPSFTAASQVLFVLIADTAGGGALVTPTATYAPATPATDNGFTTTIPNTKTYAYLVIG